MASSAPVIRRPSISRRWLWLALGAYLGLNIGLSIFSMSRAPLNPDWALWNALPEALETGDVYATDTVVRFVWSPIMAWAMAGVVLYLGYLPWAALHLVALALLRDPRLIALTLATWGFWLDLGGGNTFTFAFVAGVLAFRGSRGAAIAYLGLLLLMPRPVQLPLAIWLLLKMPETRLPFIGLAIAHATLVWASGYGGEWIGAVLAYGAGHPYDIGPGRWLGVAWLVVGVPVGAWLLLRGRPGWGGLFVNPYLLPQYLLMPLVELRPRQFRLRSMGRSA